MADSAALRTMLWAFSVADSAALESGSSKSTFYWVAKDLHIKVWPQTSSTGPRLNDVASSSFLATSVHAQYHSFATDGSPENLAHHVITDF